MLYFVCVIFSICFLLLYTVPVVCIFTVSVKMFLVSTEIFGSMLCSPLSQTYTPIEVFKGERSERQHLCHYTPTIIEAMDHISAFFPPPCRRIFYSPVFSAFILLYWPQQRQNLPLLQCAVEIISPNTTLSCKLTSFILLHVLS